MRRRMLMDKQSGSDEWTVITEEYVLHSDSTGRYQMAPTLPIDGDWTEMELTVDAISGEMSYLDTQRLNYSTRLSQYINQGPYTSPIQYKAVKENGETIITRLQGTRNIGNTISVASDTGSLGLWVHWGCPTGDMTVRGTVKYR